jgi:hypothetical protein
VVILDVVSEADGAEPRVAALKEFRVTGPASAEAFAL